MNTAVHTDHAPAAIGPYSQAVVAGNTIYVSGQIPIVPEKGELIEGGICGFYRNEQCVCGVF